VEEKLKTVRDELTSLPVGKYCQICLLMHSSMCMLTLCVLCSCKKQHVWTLWTTYKCTACLNDGVEDSHVHYSDSGRVNEQNFVLSMCHLVAFEGVDTEFFSCLHPQDLFSAHMRISACVCV